MANAKKPYTIAEELVKPCILEVVKTILGKDAERKVQQVPMSNNVIRNRITDMSEDILEQGNSYGTPAMLGNRSGFAALMKREIPEVRVTHCLLHRYALAAKTLLKSLQDVLSTCVKNVNVIRGFSLNHRLFQAFCESMDSEHTVLLYHTEGNLGRFPSLEEVVEEHESLLPEVATAIHIHFEQLLNAFVGYFSAGNLARFPSLEEVVEVHESLLPEVATAIRIHHEQLLNAFVGYFSAGNLARFPSLEEVVEVHESLLPEVATAIHIHHEQLLNVFHGYFSAGNLARFPSLEEVVEEHESVLPEVATAIRIHLEQLLNAFDGYFSAGNLARFPSLEEVVEEHESLLPEVATVAIKCLCW
ncbi:protein ZBED8-like, partial [Limulus polyphemus]|uniref:Protein ZBED8-like n=1 Tax=Limulus polyphemus TaxID=6850 RepID=A0ABM1BXY8_LIMPO